MTITTITKERRMTKAQIDIDPELWQQVRHYGVDHDPNTNELVTLALERLVMPVAGRHVADIDSRGPSPLGPSIEEIVTELEVGAAKNVTPTVEELERRTAPPQKVYPGFGRSYPA